MPEFHSRAQIPTDLDEFTAGYVECALWLMKDENGDDMDDFDGELAPDALAQIVADCTDFQASNADDLAAAEEMGRPLSHLGHDFWLTRNHHGAGFWDRDLGNVGDRLTANAHAYGEVDLYVGEDGLAYLE